MCISNVAQGYIIYIYIVNAPRVRTVALSVNISFWFHLSLLVVGSFSATIQKRLNMMKTEDGPRSVLLRFFGQSVYTRTSHTHITKCAFRHKHMRHLSPRIDIPILCGIQTMRAAYSKSVQCRHERNNTTCTHTHTQTRIQYVHILCSLSPACSLTLTIVTCVCVHHRHIIARRTVTFKARLHGVFFFFCVAFFEQLVERASYFS